MLQMAIFPADFLLVAVFPSVAVCSLPKLMLGFNQQSLLLPVWLVISLVISGLKRHYRWLAQLLHLTKKLLLELKSWLQIKNPPGKI
jgi:hypothetical protein